MPSRRALRNVMTALVVIYVLAFQLSVHTRQNLPSFQHKLREAINRASQSVSYPDLLSISLNDSAATTQKTARSASSDGSQKDKGADVTLTQLVPKTNNSAPTSVPETNTDTCENATRGNDYIVLDFKGGRTGNTLNQLHCLLALSHKFCYRAIVGPMTVFPYHQHVRPFFDVRNIEYRTSLDASASHLLTEIHSQTTQYQLSQHRHNWTLQFRCNGFSGLLGQEEFIRSSISVKNEFVREAEKCIRDLALTGKPFVTIHARRGDKVNHPEYKDYKYNDLEWYVPFFKTSMAYLKQRYGKLSFVFVSDEPDWCRSHFKGADVHVSLCKTIGCDIALIGRSDHVILTIGTFGVNAAWLGDVKSVIYSQTHVIDGHRDQGAYLPSWISIDEF